METSIKSTETISSQKGEQKKNDDSNLRNDDAVPQNNNFVQQNDNTVLQNNNTVLQNNNSVPQNDNSVLQNDNTVPQNNNSVPQNNNTVPQNNNTVPQNNNSVLQNNNSVPQNNNSGDHTQTILINKKSKKMESKKMRDERTIELFHAALTNAEEQPGVLKALEECGYDTEKLNQGKELLKETRRIFDSCLENRDLRGIAHKDFVRKKDDLNETFLRDRVKARLVYRNDPEKAALLAVAEPVSKVYPKWFATVRKFYMSVAADPATQEALARLNLTMDQINEGLTKIEEVRAARVFHMKVRAEAQNNTEAKDQSLEKMTDWMREFYGLAKLGLKREPQLLEAVGKVVRS